MGYKKKGINYTSNKQYYKGKSGASGYGVDAFADWPNFGIAGWAGGIIILYFMMQMARD
jgi:hypothetical protein